MSQNNDKQPKFGNVDASPTKEFFVEMLTRDISLGDAILDLLDNCVDGIVRSSRNKLRKSQPYEGFQADIVFDRSHFQISDNCGGIPWKLHSYAFRMGRSNARTDDENMPTVGTYGIGMKRAIFKMGHKASIQTQNDGDRFDIEIDSRWRQSESWELEATQGSTAMKEDGTTILITELSDDISEDFASKTFEDDFRRKIESHYARIISKGLIIRLNGEQVRPRPIAIVAQEPKVKGRQIRPYIFTASADGVDIFVTVGLREAIPSEGTINDELVEARYTRDLAGWTVICNDRVVLYCNKDEETGWGEAGVPKYHPQFIAISGVVEFISNDARKLPTTTTKRGIEHSSRLYAQVKNRMREGVKLFTDYTNDWKENPSQSKAQVSSTPRLTIDELKKASSKYKMTEVRTGLKGKQFKPSLPEPVSQTNRRRISFVREDSEIDEVSKFLFGDASNPASEVGAACFDHVLKAAR